MARVSGCWCGAQTYQGLKQLQQEAIRFWHPCTLNRQWQFWEEGINGEDLYSLTFVLYLLWSESFLHSFFLLSQSQLKDSLLFSPEKKKSSNNLPLYQHWFILSDTIVTNSRTTNSFTKISLRKCLSFSFLFFSFAFFSLEKVPFLPSRRQRFWHIKSVTSAKPVKIANLGENITKLTFWILENYFFPSSFGVYGSSLAFLINLILLGRHKILWVRIHPLRITTPRPCMKSETCPVFIVLFIVSCLNCCGLKSSDPLQTCKEESKQCPGEYCITMEWMVSKPKRILNNTDIE